MDEVAVPIRWAIFIRPSAFDADGNVTEIHSDHGGLTIEQAADILEAIARDLRALKDSDGAP